MLSAVLLICAIVTVVGCVHSWCFMCRVQEATETDRLIRNVIVANYASLSLAPAISPTPVSTQQSPGIARKVARGVRT